MYEYGQQRGHLVLSRRNSQRVLIGDDIILEVVFIDRDWVKLGFDAPLSVRILREELLRPRERPMRRFAPLTDIGADQPAFAPFFRGSQRRGSHGE